MKEYLLLGILQGIFEWLPISSEGIVALTSSFFLKTINPIDLALYLHLGTFFAVLVYFYKDWKKILLLKDKKTFKFLTVVTLISLVIGGLLYFLIKEIAFGKWFLIIIGIGLLITGFFHKKKFFFKISFEKLAILTGILQGLSVIPGISRSGATIFGLSFGEFSPNEILRFSYLMSAPVVLISSIFLSFKEPLLFSKGVFFSLIAAFLSGILSLKFLLKLSLKLNFFKFCLIFGGLCILGGLIEIFNQLIF